MEILKKIAKAKNQIKEIKLKKTGWNDYSKYNYFLPEQVEKIVSDACKSNNLITKFDLKRNEFGEYGILTIYDIDSNENMKYEMATAIPDIKATNIAQQLGGCVTYTERYLKMSAFGIVENDLDFDNFNNKNNLKKDEDNRPWLTEKQFQNAIARIRENKFPDGEIETKQDFLKKLREEFRMKKIYFAELNSELNDQFNTQFNYD